MLVKFYSGSGCSESKCADMEKFKHFASCCARIKKKKVQCHLFEWYTKKNLAIRSDSTLGNSSLILLMVPQ